LNNARSPAPSPKVSVIVVTHPQYLPLLETALQSLRQQQSSDFEVIVEHNEDRTLSKACNDAISRSHGKYIVRIDADDWIDPQLLYLEANHLDSSPQVDCVWCDYWKTYPQKGEGFETHYLEYHQNQDLEHACGAMYRKEVWELLGGYDEDLKYQESFDFWLRFRKAGFISERIDQPLYYYRQHPGSMSTNVEERERTRQEILDKHDLYNS